ncbi:unnamed protein product [Trichogramma brassicae]|uniref:Uncharacterized protein n=1 Tax=Trichogramma brassicae TaxID=86971 RepID=A0A6H5HRZ8_9HYME|nr:unnamed protein product [Trichogramma brassicae]
MLEENLRRDRNHDETMEWILNGLSRSLTFHYAQPTAFPLNYQVMPDLSKSIPAFTRSPAVAREWIENIQSMRVLHNSPEAFALEQACVHLLQGARDWFSARQATLNGSIFVLDFIKISDFENLIFSFNAEKKTRSRLERKNLIFNKKGSWNPMVPVKNFEKIFFEFLVKF